LRCLLNERCGALINSVLLRRAGFTGYGDVGGFNSGNRNWPLLGTVDYHFNDWLVVPCGSTPGSTPDMIREQDVQRLERRNR
jgi:hypothetical protein